MACRDLAAAQAASIRILKKHPASLLDVRGIDLASLQSVVDFVQKLRKYQVALYRNL